ncbi:pentatricopeptide repeat protein [Ophiostoma piceae UAMH 11346]|uniref:Pentatricopeptide repeat protein n=1 Tax=Ophiostoma piceae (strain UAMH 11346) TaxID=1262450 RepID=S3CAR3_OPHP1|nr:pentatricopeptide repeat protein [Ophiostoma piceae UAMH 11346]
MAGTRIVVDGLWRCLCPSVDTPALLRAINGSTATAQPALRRTPRPGAGRRGHRTLSNSAQHGIEPYATVMSAEASVNATKPPYYTHQLRHIHAGATDRIGRLDLMSSRGPNGTIQRPLPPPKSELNDEKALIHLLRAQPPCWSQLQAASTPIIYEALRQLQDSMCGIDKIEAIARFLLEERAEPPTSALCEAVLRANCSKDGSADAVKDVLQLLDDSTIEATPSLYHAALAVLAIHPDYVTRAVILSKMKERWIDVSPDGMISVAIGLLRDGQFERAIEHLDKMTAASTSAGGEAAPPPWLLDVYVYVFLQEGFLDDALKIIDQRVLRESDLVTPNLWFVMLEACCRWSHYEGLVYVWNRAVKSASGRSILTPSDAMALEILNIASQNGDSNLAAAVMQMLAARGTKLGLPHFEAMLDCYCQAGNIGKALQVLCIMNNANIIPEQATTRSLFIRLVESSEASLDDAVDSLFSLKKQYGTIPLAAFNVVIEAMLEYGAKPASDEENGPAGEDSPSTLMALDLYRHVRQLCPSGPNRMTFRLLFGACTNPQHLNFLLCEMQSFGLRPDIAYVNQVVHDNAKYGSLNAAISHVHDLMDAEEIAGTYKFEDTNSALDKELTENAAAVSDTLSEDAEVVFAADSSSSVTLSDHGRPWINRRAATALARRCIEEKDDRINAIAAASRRRGRPMDKILAIARKGPPVKPIIGVPRLIDEDEMA